MTYKDLKVGDWFIIPELDKQINFIKAIDDNNYCINISPYSLYSFTLGSQVHCLDTLEVELVMKIDFDFYTAKMYAVEIALTPVDDDINIGQYICFNDIIYFLKLDTKKYLCVWSLYEENQGVITYQYFEKWNDMYGASFHQPHFIRGEKEYI